MNLMDYFHLDQALCVRLVLTLAHFLWQGAALAVLAGIVSLACTRSAARTRYAAFVAILFLMAVAPIVTFLFVSAPDTAPAPLALPATVSPMTIETDSEPAIQPDESTIVVPPVPVVFSPPAEPVAEAVPPVSSPRWSVPRIDWARYAPHATVAYLLGVFVMVLRLAAGIWGGKRLRRRSEPVQDIAVLQPLARYAQEIGLAFTPAIAYCQRVAVPTVVGIVRPMVLLPMAIMSGLTSGQVELLLLHELAHIRRHDLVINLLQRVIEAVLFFHPAVWYVSRRIRIEREHCCDDLVVQLGGDARAYAESLVQAAALAHAVARGPLPSTALPAVGRVSELRARIARIVGAPSPQVRLVRGVWLVGLVACVLGLLALAQVQEVVPSVPPTTPTATAAPVLPEPLAAPSAEEPAQTITPPTAEPDADLLEKLGELSKQSRDPDWWLRKLAMIELANSGSPLVLETLIVGLKDEDVRVKAAAATGLGKLANPTAIKHLVATLKEENPARDAAAEALTHFDPASIMPLLKLAVEDTDPGVQNGAIVALGLQKVPEALDLLLSAMAQRGDSWEGGVVNAFAQAFSKVEAGQLQAGLIAAIDTYQKNAKALLLQVLLSMCDTAPNPVLSKLAQDSDGEIREDAVGICRQIVEKQKKEGRVVDTALVQTFVLALRDKSRVIALCALQTLRVISWIPSTPEDQAWFLATQHRWEDAAALGPVAIDPLLRCLTGDWTVNSEKDASAIRAGEFDVLGDTLAKFHDPRIAASLTQALREGLANEEAARTLRIPGIAYALGKLGDPQAVEPLIEGLRSPGRKMVIASIQALGQLKDKRAVDPLLPLLNSPEEYVQQCTALALAQIGDPRAAGPVMDLIKNQEIDKIGEYYIEALGKLAGDEAVALLTRIMEESHHSRLAALAAQTLGETKDERAIDALFKAATIRSEVALRSAAVRSIGKIGGAKAAEFLSTILMSEMFRDGSIASAWFEALRNMPEAWAIDTVLKVIDTPEFAQYALQLATFLFEKNHPKGKEVLDRLAASGHSGVEARRVLQEGTAGAAAEPAKQ